MNRKFFKSGNGWALFISKTILELLKVNPETDFVEMQMENDVLKIADFGEAKENLMKIGSISMIGTPDYLSPYRFENCFCGG